MLLILQGKKMKLKKNLSLLTALLAGVGLVACNGGGNSGPAANTAQYGQMTVESAQQFNSFMGATFGYQALLYPAMLQAGKYIESTGQVAFAYESANVANTADLYHYGVESNLNLANGYFLSESVSAYAIQYTTPGVNAATVPSDLVHNVSGLVIVPNGIKPRGVVIYFHPTTLGKNEVPSCLGSLASGLPTVSSNIPAYCGITSLDNTGAGLFAFLSATYAARGFVVIAPDYVGQGADYNSVHPYVAYPENNVMTAFNMIPGMRQILAKSFNVPKTEDLPLMVTGYSEGGGYVLKASQMAQHSQSQFIADNHLKLAMSSPQEGAYSLADQMNFAFANNYDGLFNCPTGTPDCGKTNMMLANQSNVTESVANMNSWNVVSAMSAAPGKPALTAYVLTAAANYTFQNLSGAYDVEMAHRFWSSIPMPDGTIATLYQLFSGIYGTKYTGGQIGNSIVANAFSFNNFDTNESKTVSFYLGTVPVLQDKTLPANFYGSNNSALNFIQQGVETNPNFEQILVTGSTYNWKSTSPINFIHFSYDSTVPVINANQAYSCMKNGVKYAGSPTSQAGVGQCNASSAAGNLIESTIVPNFQLTNNALQLTPMSLLDPTQVNQAAQSKFWVPAPAQIAAVLPAELASVVAVPFDHADLVVIGNIVALCTFENILKNGRNDHVCPASWSAQ